VLQVHVAAAQLLTGTLIGTVKDAQGGVLPKAIVRLSAPALIGGAETLTTNEKGQLRFPALPPGQYVEYCMTETAWVRHVVGSCISLCVCAGAIIAAADSKSSPLAKQRDDDQPRA
jgi:hypothetical protein